MSNRDDARQQLQTALEDSTDDPSPKQLAGRAGDLPVDLQTALDIVGELLEVNVDPPSDSGETSESADTGEDSGEGAGSPDANPTPRTDETTEEEAVAALDDAIAYFSSKLDSTIRDHADSGDNPGRPNTAREYFADRGWDDETIEEMRLGWAPASETALLDHLMQRGHDREAILGTGLFTDDLTPLWRGRYVLPYLDGDNQPVYAIARCTGAKGGGRVGYDGHPADGLAGKYAKLRHTDDRVPFTEPIWGHHTLREGEPVLVAEGIADAITAAEAGYAVLSPVAKEFKREHYGPLLEAIEAFDVPRVTVVPDSERAGFDAVETDEAGARIREHVTLPATSPGMGGALRTADHLGDRLEDTETAVHVADLPLPAVTEAFHKVDLDDYLNAWSGGLEPVLASAKPPEAFPEHQAATASRSTDSSNDETADEGGEHVGSDTSALWDLDLDDLENISAGDRMKNPFGHTGDSENYFVAHEHGGDVIAKDYKGKSGGVTYNGLTALLVDAGERRRDDPEGSLSDAEVFHAWKQAKKRRDLGDDDPVPYRGLVGVAVEDDLIEESDLVRRDSETGDVVEDPDDHDGDTYEALPPGTYGDALEHVREEHGVNPGREVATPDEGGEDGETYDSDPRDLLDVGVVVEPANALAAAGAVAPDDLEEPLPELERDDVDDVAIAVALADGIIDSPDEFPPDGRYTDAYYRARDHYGAPLPKYLDNSALEERKHLIYAAARRLQPKHVLDRCRSEITVEDPPGQAVAKLNPTWEDSSSGERIIVGYGRGFLCAEHSDGRPEGEKTFDPLQFVALEEGLVEDEFARLDNETFKQAYRIAREEYGAPLPKWRATVLEHVAVLPPAAQVVGDSSAGRSLEDARERTEALLRDAVDVRDRAQLLTNLPGTGKTYGAAIVADDEPILYTPPRNDLKAQIEEYAAEIRGDDAIDAEPTVRHLPILAEQPFDEDVTQAGVEAVRDRGRHLLRDRAALLGTVATDEDNSDGGGDEDDVDLARPTCPTAEGEHGDEWALAVQVASALEHNPGKIHQHSAAFFGEEMPCQHDGDCPYSLGWEQVRNPDDSADILVGSPGHAYVDSATSYFERDRDGDVVERPRAVVVDEFPGDAYVDAFGDRYLDFAAWLSDALVGIDTREGLLEAGLDTDTWVNLWLNGDGAEYGDAADLLDLLDAGRNFVAARHEADRLLNDGALDGSLPTSASLRRASEALATLRDGPDTDAGLEDVRAAIAEARDTVGRDADRLYATGDRDDAGRLYALADDLDAVLTPLEGALAAGTDGLVDDLEAAVGALPVDGDLAGLLRAAIDSLGADDPSETLLEAAITALQGGRHGCRTLATYADDGYAHPDAWALLAGAIARDVREVSTETFAFDGDEGGTFKRLTKNDATVAADKDHHGALVVDTPAFTDITGGKCPLLGLDATGRPELWKVALGRDVERRDIHDSDAARRGFLRDAGYTVVQTTDDHLPYHGDPTDKNFNEDLELVETVTDEYTGSGPDTLDEKRPAVISTKKVLEHLKDDLDETLGHDRDTSDADAGAAINYENMKGSDALGDHQTAVILGSQHYGDDKPEKWGLLAGEDAGRGDTRGDTLDYGSDVANAYLRYMREDHTMQAILRAGRNDDETVIFAHTAALRDDLPVEDEGAVLSAHSKGTLAVAEAAKQRRAEPFTAGDIAEAVADDDRAVGKRQVRNILADLRNSGYLQVLEDGGPGRSYEYELEEDPGLADVELPDPHPAGNSAPHTSEASANRTHYSWNFRSVSDTPGGGGLLPPSRPTIPASDTAAATVDGLEPPG